LSNARAQGSLFEDVACAYLAAKGYQVIGRNLVFLRKELDIVALDGDTVVFVEVKGRKSSEFGTPAEAVDHRKQAGIVRAATAYLEQTDMWDRQSRFDVITIVVSDGNEYRIDHIKDAFGA